jgi:hypothetical protein
MSGYNFCYQWQTLIEAHVVVYAAHLPQIPNLATAACVLYWPRFIHINISYNKRIPSLIKTLIYANVVP